MNFLLLDNETSFLVREDRDSHVTRLWISRIKAPGLASSASRVPAWHPVTT